MTVPEIFEIAEKRADNHNNKYKLMKNQYLIGTNSLLLIITSFLSSTALSEVTLDVFYGNYRCTFWPNFLILTTRADEQERALCPSCINFFTLIKPKLQSKYSQHRLP
jgi:hypothetical protein